MSLKCFCFVLFFLLFISIIYHHLLLLSILYKKSGRIFSTAFNIMSRLSSRWFWLQQWISWFISCQYVDSSLSWIRQITVVLSANFRSFTDMSTEMLTFCWRMNRSVERTHPWGAPVLMVVVQDYVNIEIISSKWYGTYHKHFTQNFSGLLFCSIFQILPGKIWVKIFGCLKGLVHSLKCT